ncbi:ABC transporter permease [Marinicella gelatinilytica]|uniref:hypothetical protein n=1 Tax=Marinicella gelatinilytica TaxID=2996017 RepID=UPI002260B00D|nr:hypothetical protein [Marinicella gelatinilytica]MCX7544184.1 hypothetical protein [Marinicella gelatinilytica]
MKSSIIKALVIKDIQFNKYPLLAYLVVGLIGLWLLTWEHSGAFYGGVTIILSMIIIAGAQMIITTVTTERSDHNLPFILSLPITFLQYTHAKIVANLTVFVSFWVIIVSGLMWVIFTQEAIPNGLAVYSIILMLEMLAVFFLLLFVGLVSESQTWTIVVLTITNIGLSLFMFWLSSITDIQKYMEAASPVWNSTALTIIAAEVGFIILCLGLTYYLQFRKRDFL